MSHLSSRRDAPLTALLAVEVTSIGGISSTCRNSDASQAYEMQTKARLQNIRWREIVLSPPAGIIVNSCNQLRLSAFTPERPRKTREACAFSTEKHTSIRVKVSHKHSIALGTCMYETANGNRSLTCCTKWRLLPHLEYHEYACRHPPRCAHLARYRRS